MLLEVFDLVLKPMERGIARKWSQHEEIRGLAMRFANKRFRMSHAGAPL